MHPYLVKFGNFKIPAYGVFVALGFLLALTFAVRKAPDEGISKDEMVDLAFWVLFSGILGARLYFVIENWRLFASNPLKVFYLWEGGLAVFGGLIGGTVGGVVYCRRRGLNVKRAADIVGWVLPLAQAIGRIGCLFAGCCYGKPCSLPWAITFTNPDTLARMGVPLHPTQVYHMLSNFLIFAVLTVVYNRKSFHGQIFCLYLMLYSVGRFVVEFFRGDYRVYIGPLSLPQVFCIVAFMIGAYFYMRFKND